MSPSEDGKVQVSVRNVMAQLLALGVRRGGVLLAHTSFRAVAPLEAGPDGLIDALLAALGPDGTLVMPTMTDGRTVFDPRSTPTDGMGITAELFWRRAGVVRSTHPGGSFAAQGPLAEGICAPQPLSPPHGAESPVGRVHDRDGQVLLLGVTHSENTTLHLAESIAKVPYAVSHPCLIEVDGVVRSVMISETDHCCARFRQMDDWLRPGGRQREAKVGNAAARLASSRDLVAVAIQQLASDPLVFLCAQGSGCDECDRAHASIVAPDMPGSGSRDDSLRRTY